MTDLYIADYDRSTGESYPSITSPARRVIAVTPSDTKDVTNSTGDSARCYAKALYVGTAGNLAIVAAGDRSSSGVGTAVTFTAVPIGFFPVQVRRVMSTNTTASSIIGLYDI